MIYTIKLLKGRFLDNMRERNLSQITIYQADHELKTFTGFMRGNYSITDVREITAEHIESYRAYLSKRKSRRSGKVISDRYRYRLLGIAAGFLLYLEKSGHILSDPAKGLKRTAPKRAFPKTILTKDEIRELLAAPNIRKGSELKDRAIMEMLYGSGLRGCEIRGLKLNDLDMENNYAFITGKGNKDRIVPMTKAAVRYVKLYLERVRSKYPAKSLEDSRLFINRQGKPLSKGYLGVMLNEYSARCGLEGKATPHAIRHTCATHLIENGAGVRYVQELLGHAWIDTTQIYTQVAPVNLKEAYNRTHPRCVGTKRGRPKKGAPPL